jgi:hypothetical protein
MPTGAKIASLSSEEIVRSIAITRSGSGLVDWMSRLGFACDAEQVGRVEAGSRLKFPCTVLAAKGRRAKAFRINTHILRHDVDQQHDRLCELLVLGCRTHDLQLPPVVGEAWHTAVTVRC